MKYEMQFCVGCYLPDALALAQSLLESNPHDVSFSLTLVPGQSGSFDVKKDDQVVYSKKKSGRLPTPQDLGLANYGTVLPIAENASSKKCC
ncbi:MAG: Rdx family protein [Thaumarchaeota archaeon]|nr:Rdx family protein [Nitrososphaerota archaeon]